MPLPWGPVRRSLSIPPMRLREPRRSPCQGRVARAPGLDAGGLAGEPPACAGNGQYADYVSATSRIEVCVQYPYGDPGKAIIPVLSFPGIGAIPNLPQTLKASANLLL